jgi:23S rRNA (cytosine1962-C5)-methyltransferase
VKAKASVESARVFLKAGREKSLLRRHPWVFSGAVERVEGAPQSGQTVRIVTRDGGFLALAAWNPVSNIRARIWDWKEDTVVDAEFFRSRLNAALRTRELFGSKAPDAGMRLVHGESDGLPGLIVDRYADVVVVQFSGAGCMAWRDTIVDMLQELTAARAIYERSDSDILELEGLKHSTGLLRGTLTPPIVDINEAGVKFQVDVARGHKTGFYLDQSENRVAIGKLCEGREVLNCFSYSGGFSLHALAGGARSVMSVDSSGDALEAARQHAQLNGFADERCEWVDADVFPFLRKLRDQGRQFDLIILDPPKFAPTAATAERAARGYKDINLLGFKLLRPGGLLASFSCSGGISADLFWKIVAGAALDAGVDAQVLRHFQAAPDHPVSLAFPEGEYLKGLLCRVS